MFDFSFTDIDGIGDIATARGSFTMTVKAEGDDATLIGKFMDTFRKQADDKWLYREVWRLARCGRRVSVLRRVP